MASTQTYKPMPSLTEKKAFNFWSKATLTANIDVCWIWNGWVRDEIKPYGRFAINYSNFSSPRIAYFLYYNVDPKEMHVLHTCDNPRCVNPHHLYLGTNDDNVKDKVSKGRQAINVCWNKGKITKFRNWNNKGSKLIEAQYYEVKDLYDSGGISLSEIGNKYGVSRTVVSKIIKRLGGVVEKNTTLTEDTVLKIRAEYKKNEIGCRILGNKYNIGEKTILDIVHRKTWKHI